MTADLKELAKSIAASENPYAEFDKHASELDETHTATLSRELNRQLFLQNLDNADLNNDIEFGVIDAGVSHGAAVNTDGAETVKTASEKKNLIHLVTDSMFLLSEPENRMVKMAAHGADPMFDEQSNADYDELTKFKDAELLEKKAEDKNRTARSYNELEYLVIDHLVKKASHEGDIRAYMALMVHEDKSDLVEPLLMSTNYSMDDIQKTASEELDEAEKLHLSELFREMKSIDDTFEKTASDQWLDDEVMEKIAILGSIISGGRMLGKALVEGSGKMLGKGLGAASTAVGKGAMKAGGIGLGLAGKAVKKGNRGKTMLAIGGGALGLDAISKAETNREAVVDALM